MTKSKLKADRRIAKTRIALRNAMMLLLVEQGWDDMSIQAICDKADVGRSTFYLHFSSKNDLLQQSLGELRDGLIAHAATSSENNPCASVLNGLLNHMLEELPVFSTVIGRRSAQIVASNFKTMVCELIELELKRIEHPAADNPLLIRFLAGGIHETMTWWVDAVQPCSIGELEERLYQAVDTVLENY